MVERRPRPVVAKALRKLANRPNQWHTSRAAGQPPSVLARHVEAGHLETRQFNLAMGKATLCYRITPDGLRFSGK